MFRKTLRMFKKDGFPFYGWIIVLASFLAMLVVGIVMVFGVFIEPLTQEFGWSRANISLAFSLSFLLSTFLAFPSGRMSDKYGIRKMIMIGAALTGSGFLLCSQVSSLAQLYFSFSLIGIGASTLYVPPVSTIARWFVKRKGLATGMAVSALSIGIAFFSPLTELFIGKFGWRSTFLIFGIFVISILSISSLLMKREPSEVGSAPYRGVRKTTNFQIESRAEGYNIKEAMRRRSFWYIYLILIFAHIALFAVVVHVVPHAIKLGIKKFPASTALALLGVCSVLARIIGGEISDRIGVVNLLTIFLGVQTISTFALLGSTGVWSIYLASAALGTGWGGWAAIYPLRVSGFFGTKHLGPILGIFETGVGTGGMIGPYLAGYIFDVTGGYRMAFLFGGFMVVLAMVLSVLLRKEAELGC